MKILLPDDDNINWETIEEIDFTVHHISFFVEKNTELIPAKIFIDYQNYENGDDDCHYGIGNKKKLYYDHDYIKISKDIAKEIMTNSIKHFNKLDPENFTLSDMNEYIKDQVQQYQFAKEILEKAGFEKNEIEEPEFFGIYPNGNGYLQPLNTIKLSAKKTFIDDEDYSSDLFLSVLINKDINNNNYNLKIYTNDNIKTENQWLLIGNDNCEFAKIPELKLNDGFYNQIKEDFEIYTDAILNKGEKTNIVLHDINEYINNENYKLKDNVTCNREGYSWEQQVGGVLLTSPEGEEIFLQAGDDTNQFFSELENTNDKWQDNDVIAEYFDNLKPEISPEDIERIAFVQGVCEAIAAIGDEAKCFLGKEILSKMEVTKAECEKYAKPETYKELEKTIFAPEHEQEFEQTQGVKR